MDKEIDKEVRGKRFPFGGFKNQEHSILMGWVPPLGKPRNFHSHSSSVPSLVFQPPPPSSLQMEFSVDFDTRLTNY